MSMKHLILGYGFSGFYLSSYIEMFEPQGLIIKTSRTKQFDVIFDLNDKKTWDNIPKVDFTYWLFPSVPIDAAREFYHYKKNHLGRLLVLGSTSALVASGDGEVVDESSPLDRTQERVQSEKFLREQGAMLLLSSGQYGQKRNPLSWVRDGRVGKSSKCVNMIHGEDLGQFLYQCMHLGEQKRVYIASNNNPETWSDIIQNWEERKLLSDIPHKEYTRVSKRVDCSYTIEKLKISLKYPKFSESIF